MLSAIVIAPSSPDPAAGRLQEATVRSLAALVGAAIADIVRDACIVGAPGAGLSAIADHADWRRRSRARAATGYSC